MRRGRLAPVAAGRYNRPMPGAHQLVVPDPWILASLSPALVGLLAVGAGLLLYVALTFNRLVRLRQKVREGFSGVDVQLKRRQDLVPNLVKVVKGYARHERETLEEVVEARTAARDAQTVGDRARKEEGLGRSLDRLFLLVERYPELRADENFRELHHDLVAIEDDLQYARRYYNATVRDLNTRVQVFPSNVLAGLFGFEEAPFFEIEDARERHAARIDWDA
jgi:LemA protein